MTQNEFARISLLKKIVSFENEIKTLINELSSYDWDYEGVPVVIDGSTLRNLLGRYLTEELKAADIYEWANFLEARDDIFFLEDEKQLVSEIMHQLANPDLNGGLNKSKAEAMILSLQRRS